MDGWKRMALCVVVVQTGRRGYWARGEDQPVFGRNWIWKAFVRLYRMGCFVWRDEEEVVGFMDWMWRWMGVIGMDGSDGCVGCCVGLCVVVVGVWCCVRVCVLCVECLSIQEESTPFDEPQPTPPHHTPHSPINSHTYTHPHTPPPTLHTQPIPHTQPTYNPHPTTTTPNHTTTPLHNRPNNQWSSPSQDYPLDL